MMRSLLMLLGMVVVAEASAQAVLGRYGRALGRARIFARAASNSRVYYRTTAYEPLIIRQGPSAKWRAVVMSNGALGYIPADMVVILPYEVLQSANPGSTGGGRFSASLAGRSGVASFARRYVGYTPYKWGGTNVITGADCSGFVKQMFGAIGVNLPRTAAEQALVGKPILYKEHLLPGDRLYFWDAKRGKIGHTGIYLGDGYFIHSSRGRGGVAVDGLTQKWLRQLVSARRT